MHAIQREFCSNVKNLFPAFFKEKRVLEIGSLDVNGNNNHLFICCDVTKLDVSPGKNVDIVAEGHTFRAPNFDVVFSTNALEHDPFYRLTLRNMVRLLKPKGLMFFSAAHSWGRHGTIDKDLHKLGMTLPNNVWKNHYLNMSKETITTCLNLEKIFKTHSLEYVSNDLQFWGIKKCKSNSPKKKLKT